MPTTFKNARSRYKWNDSAGRYRDASGKFVSFRRIRMALDDVLDGNERDMVRLAETLRDGGMSVGDFQRQMRTHLKDVHVASGALVKGGWKQLSQADLGRIGFRLKEQYRYLDRFAGELANTQVYDGNLVRRTRMYAQSGRVSYHRIQRADMIKRGMKFEKNVLANAEHCPDCLAETARKWVRIGTLSLVGTRQCRSNDRCHVIYK